MSRILCFLGFHKWTPWSKWQVGRAWDATLTVQLVAMRHRECVRCGKQEFDYIHTEDLGRG